jgi:hypothetical protein
MNRTSENSTWEELSVPESAMTVQRWYDSMRSDGLCGG